MLYMARDGPAWLTLLNTQWFPTSVPPLSTRGRFEIYVPPTSKILMA